MMGMLKDKKVDFAALGSFFCCSAEHDSFFAYDACNCWDLL
jgi:hypothetical protein